MRGCVMYMRACVGVNTANHLLTCAYVNVCIVSVEFHHASLGW